MAFAHPGCQHLYGFWTERRASMFSALAQTVAMRTRSQDNVPACQAYQLGNPEARLHGERK
jgi:hypothetical protein